ncbi:MAG TPA: hypothetical protein VF799_03050 [Geobacteraceae bacterium]
MKNLCLVLVALLLTACASHPPVRSDSFIISDTIKVPYDEAWQKTLQVLSAHGFAIDSSNKKGGVISAAETAVKLNERQADCGTFHGISYLRDYRTSTYMTIVIDLEKISDKTTAIRVNSFLKAYFHAGVGAEMQYLSCYSFGNLEKRLIAQIRE